MNIRDLKYLVTTADTLHFGKAAELCFVSQPTLSMQLKKLEEELGVTLFERNNKKVILTPIGKTIVVQARLILQQVDELKRIAEFAHNPLAGKIRLGAIPTVAPYLIPQILPTIQAQLPKLELYLFEEKTDRLLADLQNGDLDLIILALPIPQKNIQFIPLYEEPFLAAVPKQHPLAKLKEINNEQLRNQNILLLEEGHCLRDQALEICQHSHAQEVPGFRGTSLEMIAGMIALDHGISLFPALSKQQYAKHPGLSLRPFSNPMPKRDIIIAWRRASVLEEVARQLAKIIREQIDFSALF